LNVKQQVKSLNTSIEFLAMSHTSQGATVFLTRQEDERLRKDIRGNLERREQIRGETRASRPLSTRSQQITTASFLADIADDPDLAAMMGKPQSESMTAFVIGNPYPPCTASLDELQLLTLSDLLLEKHHRGQKIKLKLLTPMVKSKTFSWAIVQDESSDETERLEVFLHHQIKETDDLVAGSMVILKEPYMTLNKEGESSLRVDHASDLVPCGSDPNDMSSLLSTLSLSETGDGMTAQVIQVATKCKEEGNSALKKQELSKAHTAYSKGLEIVAKYNVSKEDIVFDLFRNRSHVNLLLNRLDEARGDGCSAISHVEDQRHRDLDSKANFRAGCAAYRLGDFQAAKRLFEEQLKLAPEDKEAKAYVKKSAMRLEEEQMAKYNFAKLKLGISPTRGRVDAANFTQNVEVKESPGCGRGLFAAKDINAGELVLCEKAFCVVWDNEADAWTALTYDTRDERIRAAPVGLRKVIIQKLRSNPSLVERVMDLYGDYGGIGKKLIEKDGSPVIDTFQVHDIASRNTFGLAPLTSSNEKQSAAGTANTGLWVTASYANHSCIPNTQREFVGDLLVVRAIGLIRKGEEITHEYFDTSDYDARQSELEKTWGFKCSCALCIAEEADGPAVRKKRQECRREAEAFAEREHSSRAKRISILKAERLARSIEDTYDPQRYNGIPHTATSGIKKWLEEAKGQTSRNKTSGKAT
jgi:tetratricopeptide (TPR) repeat protein